MGLFCSRLTGKVVAEPDQKPHRPPLPRPEARLWLGDPDELCKMLPRTTNSSLQGPQIGVVSVRFLSIKGKHRHPSWACVISHTQ